VEDCDSDAELVAAAVELCVRVFDGVFVGDRVELYVACDLVGVTEGVVVAEGSGTHMPYGLLSSQSTTSDSVKEHPSGETETVLAYAVEA